MAAIQTQTFNPGLGFVTPGFVRRLAGWVNRRLQDGAAASNSAVSAARIRAAEAAAVRDMAYRVQRTDPSYAADLMAAADRHEGN